MKANGVKGSLTFATMNETRRTVAFHTLGCKLNFAETSTIARDFVTNGFKRVEFDQPADVYVINTCSVTQNADDETRQIVKRAQRANPEGIVVVIGCYAQLKPEEIVAIPGVDLVLGATEKFNILRYLNDLQKSDRGTVHSCEISEANSFVSSYSIGDRTRAFLKVQDGCDYKCSYCTIPLARGISRSDSLENVLAKAAEIARQGIREIVLTGVNTGDYGKGEFGNKKHDHTFLDLIRALDEVSGIERIRISSIEPNLLRDEIIEFVAQSQHFVPHFHIPLQSGSDHILGLMRRRYRRDLYADRVMLIKSLMPHACIGADVIVGFPGETDEHFLETYEFIRTLPISYLHVFTYSERDNIPAASMTGVIPMHTRKSRNKMLRTLSAKLQRAFMESQLNTVRTVLWETENREGYIQGYTDNYIRCRTYWNPELANALQVVSLQRIDEDGFMRVEALEFSQSVNKTHASASIGVNT
ncbi:tRNA (N(6)-L-threonylcarbamoyladenosine(37)-C(2))-methylthiotran sferase MtaB [Thermaurantimonas aggregans]|uniref:Threonylcarbamoyladenosine tRNA methylthiotransferase MtaB n=1 Tax=Thermaurantimonas aggregans TaxID=2173829 RepID=A0A401XNL6_9FLAO|nr:tRNA (N(6)-L-threonylcarbamoyladenosine(37)-C(2))-methylthiotransferase MtaB [Thermaurantimonas aggregans]MCX8148022.1 tRNA (N(6)-L-threonylcarbamoyladenosine(37)-C(2))-methylthiotransferase MtaB [Thermaurantimonas aggregans]GCD78614.1 tRNA (N(6)-L-threonylcarbamoyladenosine(37)-C(2))-methylthiotran sferase MtaB [Thermaurantimonas aggregans]